MKKIIETFEFFGAVRRRLRFGEYSRLPLHIHRFEITADSAQCEWFMRPQDPWDAHLPMRIQQEHITQQSLNDALQVRELIFRSFPQVNRAGLRMYRACGDEAPELMLIGDVERETRGLRRVTSLVMQAKLCGFRFCLTGGVLERIASSEPRGSC